jgi:putative glycosyltransferase (TIGR04348 family)
LKIALVSPAVGRARNGNRNTAHRWAAFLRDLGHTVEVEREWSGAPADLMIALHARRSHASIRAYAQSFAERPLVVTLTGTDLYRDIHIDASARESLAFATRLVVLHELGANALPREHRAKTQVIVQSARAAPALSPLATCFEICVSGHLREEKDPFRAAEALRFLPADSRVRVTHIGGALSEEMAAEATTWMAREPRYRWLGEVAHWRALRMLARSRLMVISSRMEGGANVVCEALAARTAVIASRIPGNVGMLGARYPGYYPVGDARALARLISRAERDGAYYGLLEGACAARSPLVAPKRERQGLKALVAAAVRAARVTPPARARGAA